MQLTDLMPLPLLLDGFYTPYATASGVPHFGPVHAALAGETLIDHYLAQGQIEQRGPCDSYVGLGGWINLGYIARLQPRRAVLADINPLQAVYWQLHLDAVARCATQTAFAESLPAIAARVSDLAAGLPGGLNGWLVRRSDDEPAGSAFRCDVSSLVHFACDGYATTDDSYAALRGLVREGRIRTAVLDIKDTQAAARLRRQLDAGADGGQTVVYLSNALDFVKDGEEDWAGVIGPMDALSRAQANSRLLANGADGRRPGTIVYTRAMARGGVRHTAEGAIDLANWHNTLRPRRRRLRPSVG